MNRHVIFALLILVSFSFQQVHADMITWVAPDVGVWTPVPNAGVAGSGIPAGTEMRVLHSEGVYTPVVRGGTASDNGHSWTNSGANNAYGQTDNTSVVDANLRVQFNQDINGHAFVVAFENFFEDQTPGDPFILVDSSGGISPASLGEDYSIDPGFDNTKFDFTSATNGASELELSDGGMGVHSSILFDRTTHGHHLKNFFVNITGLRSNDTNWVRFGFTDTLSNGFTPPATVPEPSSLLFLGFAGVVIGVRRRYFAK